MSDPLYTSKQEAIDAIVASLTHEPNNWCWYNDSKGYIKHKTAKIMISIGSGHRPYIYEPGEVCFGFWHGRQLRRAFRSWEKKVGNDQHNAMVKATLSHIVERLHVADAR